MLVITRKIGEKLKIGDQIELVVLSCEGQRIKLGIEAPKEISILREEVFEAIQEENRLASEGQDLSKIQQWFQLAFKGGQGK